MKYAHRLFIDPKDRSDVTGMEILNEVFPNGPRIIHAHVRLNNFVTDSENYKLMAFISECPHFDNFASYNNGKDEVVFQLFQGSTSYVASVVFFNDILHFQRFAAFAGLAVHVTPEANQLYVDALNHT